MNKELMIALSSTESEKNINLLLNKILNINYEDEYGYTPLIYALIDKNPINIIELLIKKYHVFFLENVLLLWI